MIEAPRRLSACNAQAGKQRGMRELFRFKKEGKVGAASCPWHLHLKDTIFLTFNTRYPYGKAAFILEKVKMFECISRVTAFGFYIKSTWVKLLLMNS